MSSTFVIAGLTALVFVFAYTLFKHSTRPSLSDIRGPKASSFLLGNLLELFQRPVGQTDFEWQDLYGNIVRFKTVFGASAIDSKCLREYLTPTSVELQGDQLLVSDPKALQRIFNTSAYSYPKQPNLRVLSRMLNGKGIVWADGEDHKRQRKILLPGFGGPESRAFLDIFKGCAKAVGARWMEIIESSSEREVVLNVPAWLARGTLDAIGQAAFDVQFDTIQNDQHLLARTYNSLLSDILGHPSTTQIFIQAASKYVSPWILEWMADHGSNPRLIRAREAQRVATDVSKQMVQEKAESLLAGKGSRDIFSLLVRANMDADAKNKMTEEELLAQMRTIMFAGHETTSNSLSWILLELARHPEIQTKLRTEIREMEAAIQARGDTRFTTADFDGMPYVTAVIKEGLRYHPVVPHVQRIVGRDDILQLSRPITAESGQPISEIVVPKGTRIVASIAAYNRNTELWGEDAHEFNPDRWLVGVANKKKSVSIGVYSNLMTFSGGTRACLGWRFAVIEIQAFLVEMAGKFEFKMTDRSEKVVRGPSVVMVPTVEGEAERGTQLPLAVSVASREE